MQRNDSSMNACRRTEVLLRGLHLFCLCYSLLVCLFFLMFFFLCLFVLFLFFSVFSFFLMLTIDVAIALGDVACRARAWI